MAKHILLSAAAVLLATTTLASPVHPREVKVPCLSGIRVVVARGSDTPRDDIGPLWAMGAFAKAEDPDSSLHDLRYPATLANYGWSESIGVTNLTRHIRDDIDSCPKQRIVLIGYSQGAQVVGDTLVGPSGTTGEGLGPKYRDNIIAIIQMGDPAFVPGYTFDVGSATEAGVAARDNANQYLSYGFAPRIQSYCDANDMYCASGNSLAVHESYFSIYATAAEDFISSMVSKSQ